MSLEMAQNAEHLIWNKERVYAELENIMVHIFKITEKLCAKYNLGENQLALTSTGFESCRSYDDAGHCISSDTRR